MHTTHSTSTKQWYPPKMKALEYVLLSDMNGVDKHPKHSMSMDSR